MEGANVIGRADDAAIQIDAPGISRHHARIVVAGSEATVEDLVARMERNSTAFVLRRPAVLRMAMKSDRHDRIAIQGQFPGDANGDAATLDTLITRGHNDLATEFVASIVASAVVLG